MLESPCTPSTIIAREPAAGGELLAADGDAKILAGGHTLLPAMKLRLAAALGADRSRPAEGAARHRIKGDALVIGAMTPMPRCEAPPAVRAAIPGARRARRHNRRSAGAQPRHHRRLDRQQRPSGRLSGGLLALGATIGTTGARSRPTAFSRAVRDGLGAGRDHRRRCAFPMPRRSRYVKFPQPGLALRAGRRLRRQARRRRSRGGDGRRRGGVFRARALEDALLTRFAPRSLDGIAAPGRAHQRHPRRRRLPRASRGRDGEAGGRGGDAAQPARASCREAWARLWGCRSLACLAGQNLDRSSGLHRRCPRAP